MPLTDDEIKKILSDAVKRADEPTNSPSKLREIENKKAIENTRNSDYSPNRERINPRHGRDYQFLNVPPSKGSIYGEGTVSKKGQGIIGGVKYGVHGNDLVSNETYVEEGHRGKGLASALYKEIEETTGKTFKPSPLQTSEGKALWKSEERKILPKRSFGVELELKEKLKKALHSINKGKFWSIAPSLQGIPVGIEATKKMLKGDKEGAIDAIMEALSPSGAKGSLWEGVKGLTGKKKNPYNEV